MDPGAYPPFVPHPLLWSGHAQTLVSLALPGKRRIYQAEQHHLQLPDGDQLVLHDDCPPQWRPGDHTTLFVHGLIGAYDSPYITRAVAKLRSRGVRCFRLDMRACGAGEGLARGHYHFGSSEDVAAALQHVARLCPASSTTAVGVSVGGSILLKMLGECRGLPPGNLVSALAASPPMDPMLCQAALRRPLGRIYERRIVGILLARLEAHLARNPGLRADFPRRPRTLEEFAGWYMAPLAGFRTARAYYRWVDGTPRLPHIRVPTLIVSAQDDPLVPVRQFVRARRSTCVDLLLPRHGGHLGFISRRGGPDPDNWWLDWRMVDWVMRAAGEGRGCLRRAA
jgi:predicted alpha/beta-fold hydrolase